jgi:hypothetical protein
MTTTLSIIIIAPVSILFCAIGEELTISSVRQADRRAWGSLFSVIGAFAKGTSHALANRLRALHGAARYHSSRIYDHAPIDRRGRSTYTAMHITPRQEEVAKR